MLLNKLSRIYNPVIITHRRSYYSSKITSLFVDNFEKYQTRFAEESKDSTSHKKTKLKEKLASFTLITASIRDVDKELNNESQTDKELASLMSEEKAELESERNKIIANVLNEIHDYEQSKDMERIPDSSSVLFEVSAGVGGKEAMLFANDLCNLYYNYFSFKKWGMQDVESDQQPGGYLRHFQCKIEGREAWSHMKFEAGTHRVQRVPETETRGRIHTSTVSVACIPITDDADVDINGKTAA